MFEKITVVILIIFAAFILTLSLRGRVGNPTSLELNQPGWTDNGPFELSPERGKFALTYSMVEDKSLQLSVPLAKFSSPDVGVVNNHYVSLFPPGVALITTPGYIIGRFLNISQVGTFAIVSLFAIFNLLLIRQIAIKLGANHIAASLSGLVFLFATPSFTYAVDLYQHHLSTFIILMSIFALMSFGDYLAVIIVFVLAGLSVSIDYPNLFFAVPLCLYALTRIFKVDRSARKVILKTNFLKFILPIVIIFPLIFLLWFQKISYGNPFQLAGTVKTVKEVKTTDNIMQTQDLSTLNLSDNQASRSATIPASQKQNRTASEYKKEAVLFFKTRSLTNGLYIHFLSPDRGMIFYTPVILLGFLGLVLTLKKNVKYTPLLVSVLAINIILYSMWSDPWGGWAFGSRYLIPSYAILAIFVALLLTYWRRNLVFLFVFLVLVIYSVLINTVGAITSSRNPPQVEVLALEKVSHQQQKYTFGRNIDLLNQDYSKSFIFMEFASKFMTAWQYYLLVSSFIIEADFLLILYFWLTHRQELNQ